ncbi:ABC transporter, ATP-binding protein [Citrifermentans bemidjiense Bem]|uniref:ABC transporter, ATP-binding protein n=1 Tax=Citrifermentans bemidjiense (strain ATCC BAA-1014 / DSM 16622 / JCM 12645 / Bem) TaxID=404380 RepID=B5EIP9_CITBB|nr:ABC transporter ATP-binding protein [Citrifermentans bemidjiense]ACH38414.1 ABC transporter, ATP-binding protein [Citrifermentans bemidjiense Bem]
MDRYGTVVNCKGVTKSYGTGAARVHALRGVDLEIRYGEVLMLVGPSGSGKTTLLSLISGILDPDDGECAVLDHVYRDFSATERARFRGRAIGFVFQAFNLLPSLTAAENVAVPMLINGISRRDAALKARRMLDAIGLGGRVDALPDQLSGGEQQRVAVARALVHGPKILLCDEPTSNLDHASGDHVMEMLRREALAPDRAVVVVTHDIRLFRFADRITHLEDGMLVESNPGRTRETSP